MDGLAGPWWAGVCRDEGVNGSQGRHKRPVLDALLKGVACREFEIVAAWLVCRLGRFAQWPDRFAGLSYRPRDDRVMAGLESHPVIWQTPRAEEQAYFQGDTGEAQGLQ